MMSLFEKIPNKQPCETVHESSDVWPELGMSFELNMFYKQYSNAEGWLGEGYLMMWTRNEIEEFRGSTMEAYPEKYHFFASDGGGSQFGFVVDKGGVSYVSAPDIGGEEDIRVLGNWHQFLSSIELGDYI